MPTNHRGQEIGAHNHANLVTRVRHANEHVVVNLLGQEGGESPEYSVFSDNREFPPVAKYQATTYSMPMADADGNPTNNLSIGYYSNPRRAEMAGIARANRHARTGDWGDQIEIKNRIAASKNRAK